MQSNKRTSDSSEETYVKMRSDLRMGPPGGGRRRKRCNSSKKLNISRTPTQEGGVLLHSKGEEKEEQVVSFHSLFVDTQAPKYKPEIPEHETCESTFLSKPHNSFRK